MADGQRIHVTVTEYTHSMDSIRDMFTAVQHRLDNGTELFHKLQLDQKSITGEIQTIATQQNYSAAQLQTLSDNFRTHVQNTAAFPSRLAILESDMNRINVMPDDIQEMKLQLRGLCATLAADDKNEGKNKQWWMAVLKLLIPFILFSLGYLVSDWRAMQKALYTPTSVVNTPTSHKDDGAE